MMPYSFNQSGFNIHSETEKDIFAVRRLNIDVFKRNNEADLVDRLRREKRFTNDMSLVAENANGQIIGHILFSQIDCHTDLGFVKTGAIGPGAIDPGYRNLALARKLMDGLIAQAKHLQFELLLIVARPKVYGRIGFSAELARKIQSPYSRAADAFMALELRRGCIVNASFAQASYPEAWAECDNGGRQANDLPSSISNSLTP